MSFEYQNGKFGFERNGNVEGLWIPNRTMTQSTVLGRSIQPGLIEEIRDQS